jgi:hypothetical protein
MFGLMMTASAHRWRNRFIALAVTIRRSTIFRGKMHTLLNRRAEILRDTVSFVLRRGLGIPLALGCAFSGAVAAERPVTETIVLIRQGEKPALGLGQLNCQGLNRALALPVVIGREFAARRNL